jgi:hypothetical protein
MTETITTQVFGKGEANMKKQLLATILTLGLGSAVSTQLHAQDKQDKMSQDKMADGKMTDGKMDAKKKKKSKKSDSKMSDDKMAHDKMADKKQ